MIIVDELARNVEFHCQCMDDNGMMITGTRWLLSDGTSAPTQNFNIPPAVLLIAHPFDSTDAGIYICSPNNMQNDPSRDTITLSTGSEYAATLICNSYNMGKRDLPDIYAQARGHIYQENPECPCYN